MSDSILAHLTMKLNEQRELIKEDLSRGASSLEGYHKLCGVSRGLDYAKAMIEDLADQLEKDDE